MFSVIEVRNEKKKNNFEYVSCTILNIAFACDNHFKFIVIVHFQLSKFTYKFLSIGHTAFQLS